MKVNNIYAGVLTEVKGNSVVLTDGDETYEITVKEKGKNILTADPSRKTPVILIADKDGVLVTFRYYGGHYDALETIPSREDAEKTVKVRTHLILGRVTRARAIEGTNRAALTIAVGTGDSTEWISMTAWDDNASKAVMELATEEGEKKPVIMAKASQHKYTRANGEEATSYNLLDYTLIPQ